MEKEDIKMLGDQYTKGYSKAEALLDSEEFKKLLKEYTSELNNSYEFQGFSDGVTDSIDLAINDVEYTAK